MARHLENVYSRETTQEMQRYEVSTDSLPFESACPIILSDIVSAIRSLPSNKTPYVDHHYSNYAGDGPMSPKVGEWLKPISLTSIFRKILERCLQNDIQFYSSPIDIVQVRFRECCGSLDQTLCLAEICQILRIHYEVKPTLIFVDIKPVYDTVNYNLV
ncbi:hypothetical protein G6F36_013732 [Rhizopus arrhizus]|nr:hypothetical protein G6F36_013732 [Rhizopus arrhizus]KAG1519394.1 hypothetical protein G6F52_008664 [Rhizopus delemar]